MSHSRTILGLDSGGTSTKGCVLDQEGRLLRSFEGPALNLNSLGETAFQDHAGAVLDLAGDLSSYEAVGWGISGISNVKTREIVESQLRKRNAPERTCVMGDHEAALWGAHPEGEGIILISGTGSIALGQKRTKDGIFMSARSGGYGHLIDDEGSAYAIGRDILALIVQAEDGRADATILKELVFEHLQLASLADLLGWLYASSTTKQDVAKLSVYLEQAIEQGEKGARAIAEKAASALAVLTLTVLKRLQDADLPIAFLGGVLLGNQVIRAKTEAKISLRCGIANIRKAEHDAAYGAAIRALRLDQDIR